MSTFGQNGERKAPCVCSSPARPVTSARARSRPRCRRPHRRRPRTLPCVRHGARGRGRRGPARVPRRSQQSRRGRQGFRRRDPPRLQARVDLCGGIRSRRRIRLAGGRRDRGRACDVATTAAVRPRANPRHVSDLTDAAKSVHDGGRDVDIATKSDVDWPVSSSECGVVGERGTRVRPISGFDCISEGVQHLDRNDDERVLGVSPNEHAVYRFRPADI